MNVVGQEGQKEKEMNDFFFFFFFGKNLIL